MMGMVSDLNAAVFKRTSHMLISRFCPVLSALIIFMYVLSVSCQLNLKTVVSGCDEGLLKPHKIPLPPADPTLEFIFAIFRHGIRTSVLDKENPGKLTDFGKMQMYEVGKRLRERYGAFLGNYNKTKINVTSPGVTRAVESATIVMTGLFPNVREPIIPITDQVLDKYYLLENQERASKHCPRFGQIIRNGNETIFAPDVRPKYKQLYRFLEKHPVFPEFQSTIAHACGAFDILHFNCLNGNQLPEWATKPQPEFDDKPLHPDALLPLWLEYNKNTILQDSERFITGPFFNGIVDAMIKKPGRLRFHSTHDSVLFPLLWALHIEDGSNIEPGDGLVFELHRIDGGEIMKIFHYNALNGHSMTEVTSPICSSPCFLLKSPILSLTPEDWNEQCALVHPEPIPWIMDK